MFAPAQAHRRCAGQSERPRQNGSDGTLPLAIPVFYVVGRFMVAGPTLGGMKGQVGERAPKG
jgi:hypothetical protein